MAFLVEPVVRSLVDTLIDDFHAAATPAERAQAQDYVLSTLARVPGHFRLGLTGLAVLFGLWSLPRHGRPFHGLNPAQRMRQVRAWRRSRLAVFGSMLAFYTSFATFGLYSAVYGGYGGAVRL